MNSTFKTILLTVLTLSVLTIAMIEVSGISTVKLSKLFDFSSDTPAKKEEKPAQPDANSEKIAREAKAKEMPKTQIRVKDSIHKFEKIKEGDKARHTYTVENIGENPLMIANVQVSCGCTVPEFAKEAIPPGGTGEITLEFNSKGKGGRVNKKNALIICNASNAPYSIGFEIDVE